MTAARPQKISAKKYVFARDGKAGVPPCGAANGAVVAASQRLHEKVECGPLHASPLASGRMHPCKPLPQDAPGAAPEQPSRLYEKQNFFDPVSFDDVLHIPSSLAGKRAPVGTLLLPLPRLVLSCFTSVFVVLNAPAMASAAACSNFHLRLRAFLPTSAP